MKPEYFIASLLALLLCASCGKKSPLAGADAVLLADFESQRPVWAKEYPEEYAAWLAAEQAANDEDSLAKTILYAGFDAGKKLSAGKGFARRDGQLLRCLDCHNPQNMKLMVSDPALATAYHEFRGKDIGKAGKKELRSLVFAQAHAEFYLIQDANGEPQKKYPWSEKGFSMAAIERYYDNIGHSDFIHALSKTPLLKAHAPDFELGSIGSHAQRGLSCADCHMPKIKDHTGKKITLHNFQPVMNNPASCQSCHREDEKTLRRMVTEQEESVAKLAAQVEELLIKAHFETKDAIDHGANDEELAAIRKFIRRAQWRWDFVVSAKSAAFHAPLEAKRYLFDAIDQAEQARRLLSSVRHKYGQTGEVIIPKNP